MDCKKISIIIPVYNAELYLKTCIDSVINQTYQNLEIILINDGSIDQSLKICLEYAQKDERIIVIDLEKNSGQSNARNLGLEKSSGDYLGFVDSDDWIDLDMYGYLADLIKKTNSDIAKIGNSKVYQEKISRNDKKERVSIYKNSQILKRFLLKDDYTLCNKLYKRFLFENIKFETGTIYEDMLPLYKIMNQCKKMVESNQIKYFYRIMDGSTTVSCFKKRDLALLNECQKMVDLSIRETTEIQKLTEVRLNRSYLSLLVKIGKYGYDRSITNQEIEYYIEMFRRKIKQNMRGLLFSKIPLSRKIVVILASINRNLFFKVFRLYSKIKFKRSYK
ncbi:glycosyltransferase family 2 protein [Eubacterium callanderi]|uniref:glycosyltransferase family 2 protein n=1 Tax=Eubacterium callanderi TaxID=53442 RepID=UPI0011DDDF09|nr:glycosyltransferase family 2 protein [Eubacterium callanderi]WPK76451.1 Undecaprenyl-phosphate 4-deoxy-4-formamido-L-arabinose transferase [Eubacterium callanderi]